MAIKLLSWPELNPAQPLSSYETTQREYSIASFIETYQNELPQLAMIKKGYLGDTDSNSLDTGKVKSFSKCKYISYTFQVISSVNYFLIDT